MNYHVIRYVDKNGELVGYRSDSVGSVNPTWGKVYSNASELFHSLRDKAKEEHSGHKKAAEAFGRINPGAADLFLSGDSTDKLQRSHKVQLLQVKAYKGYNNDAYNSEDFAKLMKSAKVVEEAELKK